MKVSNNVVGTPGLTGEITSVFALKLAFKDGVLVGVVLGDPDRTYTLDANGGVTSEPFTPNAAPAGGPASDRKDDGL